MRAIVKHSPGPGLEMVDVPIPTPGPGEVRIQVKATSICGTDLHIRSWDPWAAEHVITPLIVGHEMCGIVEAHGEGETLPALGSLVSVESHVVCGVCAWCRTAKGHLCPETQILGVHRNGVYAEYVCVPAENAWVDPPDMPLSIASLQESFGNAVHTASVPDVSGRKVLVTGCGPVGVMAIAAVKALGARSVYATDVSDFRLDMAARIGADVIVNVSRDSPREMIAKETDGEGVDVLLEMSGAPTALADGLSLLKYGGEAALLGLFSSPVAFDFDDNLIFKGATLHGIAGRRLWDTWYQMRAMLRSGAVDLSPVVTHRFALDDYEAAFDLMASGECGKVVMFPDPDDADGPLTTP
ncbi:L-threonine 3-dehydrogenase [bacterium]|nr:L-threonine 3-dehydrogenase [bacterium]